MIAELAIAARHYVLTILREVPSSTEKREVFHVLGAMGYGGFALGDVVGIRAGLQQTNSTKENEGTIPSNAI